MEEEELKITENILKKLKSAKIFNDHVIYFKYFVS